jgi:predicted dinucleotide-binding enzyme
MQIAIIGAGNVGGALGKAWARTGHAITYGVPDPSDEKHRATAEAAGGAGLFSVGQAVQRADAIVLAVPFDAVAGVLAAAGDLSGQLVIDVTNPLRLGAAGLELSLGFDRSAAEHVASLVPTADRGRDAHCWAPPAQIRTSSIRASGSYLGCLTAKR